MDGYMAAEVSYKNGYQAGYQAGYYDGKKGVGYTSSWGTGANHKRPCMNCGFTGTATKFCPECGAAMKNPFKHDTVLD